jgi:protein SDA1
MGQNEGQALAYGHTKDTEGIEGLELLDEHFAAMRKEANGGVSDDSDAGLPDEDDEAGWDNWDLESNHSEASSVWEEVSEDGDER